MPTYGVIHQTADFIARAIPKRDNPFVQELIELLQILDGVQDKNPDVTIGIQSGGGLRILYGGLPITLLIPSQKHLRVFSDDKSLRAVLRRNSSSGIIEEVAVNTEKNKYVYWKVQKDAVALLSKYFASLPKLHDHGLIPDGGHARNFPGSVREAAFNAFLRAGSFCPGVHRKKPRHKLNLDVDRICFDHILPWSKGGTSTASNIQVLCETCNSVKTDTSL